MELTEETKKEWKIVSKNKYTKQIIKYIKKNLICMCIIFITMFVISKPILKILLNYYGIQTTSIKITESIDLQIAFTCYMTILLSIPMISNSIFFFLEKKHKKPVLYSFFLSIIGLFMGLTIMTKQILTGLSNNSIVVGTYSIKNILTFGMSIGFVTALSLQLILLIPILHKYKIIDTSKYTLVTSGIILLISYWICTIITPTDITSTLITMLPMNLSIFLGVKFSKKIKGDKKNDDTWN